MSSETTSQFPFASEEITRLVPAENERTDELFTELYALQDQLDLFVREEKSIQAALDEAKLRPQTGFMAESVKATISSLENQLSMTRYQRQQTQQAIERNTQELQTVQEEVRQERSRLQKLLTLATKIQEKEQEYDSLLEPVRREQQALQGALENPRLQNALQAREMREKEHLRSQLEPISQELQQLRAELQRLDSDKAMGTYYGERTDKYGLPQKRELAAAETQQVTPSTYEPLPFDSLNGDSVAAKVSAPIEVKRESTLEPTLEVEPEPAPVVETEPREEESETLAPATAPVEETTETEVETPAEVEAAETDGFNLEEFLNTYATLEGTEEPDETSKSESVPETPPSTPSVEEQFEQINSEYLASKDLKNYQEKLEALLSEHPQNPEVITQLLHVYIETNEIARAKDLFNASETLLTNQVDKALFEAYFLLTEAEFDKSKLEPAQQKLEFVLSQRPDDNVAREMLDLTIKAREHEAAKKEEKPPQVPPETPPADPFSDVFDGHPGPSVTLPQFSREAPARNDLDLLLHAPTENEKILQLREEIQQLENRTHPIFEERAMFLGQKTDPVYVYMQNNLEARVNALRSELLNKIYLELNPDMRTRADRLRQKAEQVGAEAKNFGKRAAQYRPGRGNQPEPTADKKSEASTESGMMYMPNTRNLVPAPAEGMFNKAKNRLKGIRDRFSREKKDENVPDPKLQAAWNEALAKDRSSGGENSTGHREALLRAQLSFGDMEALEDTLRFLNPEPVDSLTPEQMENAVNEYNLKVGKRFISYEDPLEYANWHGKVSIYPNGYMQFTRFTDK